MSYCVYNDLIPEIPESELIQLTDDGRTGLPGYPVAAAAIDAEADVMDVYLGRAVALPIAAAQIPPVLKRLNAAMAIHRLFSRVRAVPEHWEKRYRQCLDMLKAIADGEISLGIHPEPDAPDEEDTRGKATAWSRDALFGPDEMEKY